MSLSPSTSSCSSESPLCLKPVFDSNKPVFPVLISEMSLSPSPAFDFSSVGSGSSLASLSTCNSLGNHGEEKADRLMRALSTVGTLDSFKEDSKKDSDMSQLERGLGEMSFKDDVDDSIFNDLDALINHRQDTPEAAIDMNDPQIEANLMALAKLEDPYHAGSGFIPMPTQNLRINRGLNVQNRQMMYPGGDVSVRRTLAPRSVPEHQPSYGLNFGPSHLKNLNTMVKFGHLGSNTGDFNSPHGFCIGPREEIIVADTLNHRIQVFEITGRLMYVLGVEGKGDGELFFPRKILYNELNSTLVVCDRGGVRSRMQIFHWPSGRFMRKIDISFVDIVAGMAITPEGGIAVVDSVKPTLFFISAAEANGVAPPAIMGPRHNLDYIDCSSYMKEPSDVAQFRGEYYLCDFKAHRVVVVDSQGAFKRTIGDQTVTPYPNGIEVSDAGDVLVGDSHGNQFHVAVFGRNSEVLAQFTCPQVKVSRCCGLKITAGGWIVTLAKNNHHVLVMDKLTL